VCIAVVVAACLLDARFRHWFVVPVGLCGMAIGTDAIRWLRGRTDVFDPVGILGLFGFYFFFAAPLLHVRWDEWMRYVAPPPDWRPWLGRIAILNLAGLVLYRVSKRVMTSREQGQRRGRVWLMNAEAFTPVMFVGLACTLVLQLLVYRHYGGLRGYVGAFEAGQGAFVGKGWLFVISESFPVLAFMVYALLARRSPAARSPAGISLSLAAFFVLRMLFGGLRGSRSNTVWGLFWAAGIVHLWIRPLRRKMIYAGLVVLVAFTYLYGFYKSAGLGVVETLRDRASLVDLEEQTGRTFRRMLLQDFGRSDDQAFLLYRLSRHPDEYDLAWGRTYAGGLAVLIPRALWPERPPTKVKEGTEIQYGSGSWRPEGLYSSRVYGLAGEAMLNFGAAAVPAAFVALGLLVSGTRRALYSLEPSDLRRMLLPLLINLCLVLLLMDSDNVVFFLAKNGTVPFSLVWLSARRVQRMRVAGGESTSPSHSTHQSGEGALGTGRA
jgi:hypothetical protein